MNFRKILNQLILLIAAVAFLENSGCRDAVTTAINDTGAFETGTFDRSINYNGLERTYRIYISATYLNTKPWPLVIALHGGEGTGELMESFTLGGFNQLADKNGFIVVYPDAIEKHWNDGRAVQRFRSHRENIDDVGFVSALIDSLEQDLLIDKKRIYVTGVSNGAMMAHRLACELSGKIAAIAPVIGAISENIVSHCAPTRPISVLAMNGTEDPQVPWEGGFVRNGILTSGKVISVSNTVMHWVNHNNCSSTPIIAWEPDRDPQDSTRVRREVYAGGREGTEVILYAIEGGGHTWPGGNQYLPVSIVGRVSRDMTDASEFIWNFFKTHPMP